MRPPIPSGARSSALIAGASLVATALNYVFLLAAGRLLGSDDYGAMAALLGLLTLVLLPTGAVQLAVSREVSRRVATGDEQGADAFGRAALRLGLIATVPLVAIGLAVVVPLRQLLDVESTSAVAFAMAGLAVAVALPIAMGVLQGYQRFSAIAALYILPFVLRLALLAVVAALGYRLGGAVFAAVVGGIATTIVALWLLREPLRRGATAARPALRPFLRYLWPVLVGLIGVAVLTNVDLLVVRARFTEDAGEYAAASAFSRLAFFLPATILAVLFPRTAARQARGEDTADILGRSLLVTAAFGGLLAVFYAMAGRGLVHTSFGAEFADGGEYLVSFTVTMVLFALVNVLVGYHLSRDETRYAWIVAAAVPAQIAVLALVPNGVRGVIWADIAIGVALLAAHELFVESSVPAFRAGFGHLSAARGAQLRRVAKEGVVVLIVASAFVSALFWPIVSNFGSAFIGSHGSDSSGTVSWFWRLQQEGYHLFGSTTHVLWGAPIGWEQGNGLNIQLLLFYYPGYLATMVIGEVAAYNLVLLSGYVLSGAAMYLLARYLGCNRLVSAWAGLVFIVFPKHLEHAEHAAFVHLEVLVILVLALVVAAERRTTWHFLLVGLATLACFLTAGYFGVMAAIGAGAFALGAAVVVRGGSRLRLIAGLTTAAFLATLLLGFAGVAGGVGTGEGLNRQLTDLSVYGLRPSELVVPSADNLVIGERLSSYHASRLHGSNPLEVGNYVGLLTIALALGWLIVAWRRRLELGNRARLATAGLVGMLAAALVFSTPSPVGVFGRLVSWTPSRVLWELIPAFRVPSRWTMVVMTALVPLAALGLQAAWTALGRRRRASNRNVGFSQVLLVGVAMLFSFLELTSNTVDEVAHTSPVPPEYEAVASTPPGVLAEYPLVASEIYSLWQREHGRPLLNGAPDGTPANDLRRALLDPRVEGTAAALASLGVTAITIHPRTLDVEVVASTPSQEMGYRLVERFPDGSSVWEVTAPPAPAVAFPRGPDFGLIVTEAGDVLHPLSGSNGRMELIAKTASVVDLRFDAIPAGETHSIRIAGADGETTVELEGRETVSLNVAVPAGRSSLTFWVEPPPEGGGVGVELSSPRVTLASGPPVVRAVPVEP